MIRGARTPVGDMNDGISVSGCVASPFTLILASVLVEPDLVGRVRVGDVVDVHAQFEAVACRSGTAGRTGHRR